MYYSTAAEELTLQPRRLGDEDQDLRPRNKLLRHLHILIWKSYVQRQRRWRLLLFETVLAGIFFIMAVFIAKPVFLTALEPEPEPPISTSDILGSLNKKNIIGFAPTTEPYVTIMSRAAMLLEHDIYGAASEEELNYNLLVQSNSGQISDPVIWIIWKPIKNATWQFSIRSTERAMYETSSTATYTHPHLRAGFLAVQLAISRAIIEHAATTKVPDYTITLVSMPVSPLMQEETVRRALSGILLCFTLALMAPMFETVALVVHETVTRFKRALCIRGVPYVTIYTSWLVYGLMTSLPICILGAITIILIFRWIHLILALVLMLAYATVMIMIGFIMSMFHSKPWIACVWTALFALLQTYLAELLVHHQYDKEHDALAFLLHVLLPPLGLVHAFNNFALLQTGRSHTTDKDTELIIFTLFCWGVCCVLSFLLLMMLQHTLKKRAITGQVSWKSIIFKKEEDVNKLRVIGNPTGTERLQEVDELLAKAISFRSVTKTVMGVVILNNVTFDIYRGEFTMLFTEHIQENILSTLENLIVGLTLPDSGTVTVCGHEMSYESNVMTTPHLMGYCHRPSVLIDDMTVREHLIMYFDIIMWSQSREFIFQYSDIRTAQLLQECDLISVANYRVCDLDVYYKAQLCWAIAMMLEPRVIFLPNPEYSSGYLAVIKHKIMQYRKQITIVTSFNSSFQLEYADRVFLFDNKILTFGGTPAYMFFQYGREYKVRMTLRSEKGSNDEATEALLAKAAEAGATVRAHLGSLLILRVPASPTENVAKLVQEVHQNSAKYGLISMNISVPDCEEVFRRAINKVRREKNEIEINETLSKSAVNSFAEPVEWKKRHKSFLKQFEVIGWKVFYFYRNNKHFLMLLLLSAFLAGIMLGLSFSRLLLDSERESAAKTLLHGELLTVENTNQKTVLMMRSDESATAMSVANSYVFSEANSNKRNIDKITYTTISRSESLVEYLVTRAIDAPQKYIFLYAYGLDIYNNENGTLAVNALYCPLHHDYSAAARSMAKSFTALLRHCTENYAASIQVTDDPLALDLSPWMKFAKKPPLLTQFLLIMSTCHITLIPSLEHGLVRHTQKHAMCFSPARYWLTLYMWDLIVYWMMVGIMSVMMLLVMLFTAPESSFSYVDLLMVPFLLSFYGISCIPQAYLFSLGPRVALNFMTYIFFNVVFGETTIIAKIFYGDIFDILHIFMSLSPQFNIAYALVKIKTTYLYNSECYIFETQKLCAKKTLHKCCEKCGVLQACFTRMAYTIGILYQLLALITTAILLTGILMLIEYQVFDRMWKYLVMKWITTKPANVALQPGAAREKADVEDKRRQISFEQNLSKRCKGKKIDTFGEYILAQDLTKKNIGVLDMTGIYLGVGKGEAVAVTGLKTHGRRQLSDLLAGVTMADEGHVWCMSKWVQEKDPHTYAQHISYCCAKETLPQWMSVYNGLCMIATLRGVPEKYVQVEVRNMIDAMDLNKEVDTQIRHIPRTELTKLHFATALVGTPPVIILDEYTAHQRFSVRRAMYNILVNLRKKGHALIICSDNVESHLPVTNRLAIMLKGSIFDIDSVDKLVARYSTKGYTVVLHLKDDVNVNEMLSRHFEQFLINDTSEVLVNVQILDPNLNWATIFEKMENLKHTNHQVYSYIITVTTIDYIYHKILQKDTGTKPSDFYSVFKIKSMDKKLKYVPNEVTLQQLRPFKTKYNITKLNELPWSVIFHR